MSLVYAGFDPGIGNPAVVAIARTPNGYELRKAISVRTDTHDSLEDRCNEISDALSEVIRGTHPEVLGIENVLGVSSKSRGPEQQLSSSRELGFNANNDKTIVTVGIAIAVARVYRVPVLLIHPRTAKVAVLGKGRRGRAKSKADVQTAVNILLGSQLSQALCDAASLAFASAQRAALVRRAG